STDDGILRGPGSFDMLTGAIMSVHATAILRDHLGEAGLEGLSILVTGDEEIGSLSSSELIRAEAAEAAAVFVLAASAGRARQPGAQARAQGHEQLRPRLLGQGLPCRARAGEGDQRGHGPGPDSAAGGGPRR